MRATICKQFTFHAAHVIPHHRGKCSQPHGHTYRVEVCVEGPVQEQGPEAGMVMDFERIKEAWRDVEQLLDHRDLNESLVATDAIPHSTAEHLANYLLGYFRQALVPLVIDESEDYASVERVLVWETPTSWAEAS